MGQYRLYFLATNQKLKLLYDTLTYLFNTGPYGPGNCKVLLVLHCSSDDGQISLATMVECRLLLLLTMSHVFKMLCHFEL